MKIFIPITALIKCVVTQIYIIFKNDLFADPIVLDSLFVRV
jgi:hypothetical protein